MCPSDGFYPPFRTIFAHTLTFLLVPLPYQTNHKTKTINVMDNNTYLLIQNYYTDNSQRLVYFAQKCGMSKEDAEDIVQDAFLFLITRERVIFPKTFPALMQNIVANRVKDYKRHKIFKDQHEHYIKMNGNISEDGMSIVSMHETELWLQKSIARLDRRCCRIYRMHIEEGKKVAEIAVHLNIKYKTVENRLGMARKEVRQFLAAMCL